MDIQNNGFLSIDQLKERYLTPKAETRESKAATPFDAVLQKKQLEMGTVGELRFSKHASARLADRGIRLSQNQLERLAGGAAKAGMKGINESLVLVDELAFIVNVPSKTVITALDSTRADENVFTNINGAVIM